MLIAALVIGAGVTSVSAEALGEGVKILGYNGGWVLILVGAAVALIGGATKLLEGHVKTLALIGGILVAVGGIGMIGIDIEEAPELSTVESVT